MEKQNAVATLKESIRILELQQDEEGQILKEHFKITYESLKPVNLIKNSIKDLASSFELKSSLFETLFSIVSGYFAQRMVVSSKSSLLKKIMGSMMQFGINNLLLKNIDTIRTFFSDLIDKYIHPEMETTETEIPEHEV